QSDIIRQLSDKELNRHLFVTQLLLLVLSLILSLFLFDDLSVWRLYFNWDWLAIGYYGIIPGLVIVAVDIILMLVFPRRFYDDGGINKRIFSNRSISGIAFLAMLVAVSEELLFRGVIQTVFGYVIASTLFAAI